MTTTPTESDVLWLQMQGFVGADVQAESVARDPVNQPMIRHWCDATGDQNPVYTDPDAAADSAHGGIVAPPTMLQAWNMRGLRIADETGGAQVPVTELLDQAGFTSVVATNCEQEYVRYLRPGDLLSESTAVEEISPRKRTALGDGYFVTTLRTYRDQGGEVVGRMRFRILKFRPAAEGPPPAERPWPRPPINTDTSFFWDGTRLGELRVQRCAACQVLRHPPSPGCAICGSLEWDHVVSTGRGTVYSFVVHHHPPVPPLETPFVVALVELDEGTRIVGNVVGCDPAEVEVGRPVEVRFVPIDGDLVLPQWALA